MFSTSIPILQAANLEYRDAFRLPTEFMSAFTPVTQRDVAQARAAEAGYHLEEIWTREPGMNGHRVARIVQARGIAGVIFPAHHEFDFSLLNHDWRSLALVGCNDYRLSEWVDVVCPDYYRN